MAFEITITAVAESHMQSLSSRQRRTLETAILKRLQHQPTMPTKSIKRLRQTRWLSLNFG